VFTNILGHLVLESNPITLQKKRPASAATGNGRGRKAADGGGDATVAPKRQRRTAAGAEAGGEGATVVGVDAVDIVQPPPLSTLEEITADDYTKPGTPIL
jgi:hypothetical protein